MLQCERLRFDMPLQSRLPCVKYLAYFPYTLLLAFCYPMSHKKNNFFVLADLPFSSSGFHISVAMLFVNITSGFLLIFLLLISGSVLSLVMVVTERLCCFIAPLFFFCQKRVLKAPNLFVFFNLVSQDCPWHHI